MHRKHFSERWIDALLEHVDIVQVITDAGLELKEHSAKGEFVASCPFYKEATPSFTIVPIKGMYFCHGCGAVGNAITFLMDYNYWNYRQSVVYLAKMAGFPFSKTVKKRRKRHGRNKNWKPKEMS